MPVVSQGALTVPIPGHWQRVEGSGTLDLATVGELLATLWVAGFAVYVFVLSIGLWEAYHDRGLVPEGWMWFLAYTSTFLGMFTHAMATLILDARGGGHGQQG